MPRAAAKEKPSHPPSHPLARYQAKRNFARTPEPAEGGTESPEARVFVIQKHWASRLHYDFRLELGGTMKSWAVPKGPSYDRRVRRMAVQVEDHPLSYNSFEGEIPARQYGAGKVLIWDKGTWEPVGDPERGLREGHLKFQLHGHKMRGRWALVRTQGGSERQPAWLLVKDRDAYERPATEFSVVDEFPDSVAALPMPPLPRQSSAAASDATAPPLSAPPKAARKPARKPARKSARSSARGQTPVLPPQALAVAELPQKLRPVLATLVDRPPADAANWVFEIKFDGYRMLARVDKGEVRLLTRNGHDWSDRMPHLVQAIGRLGLPSAWLDGEVVMLGEHGGTDFQALQNAFDSARTAQIVFFLFDLPYFNGHDLRAVPLDARRALLAELIDGAPAALRFSEAFDAAPSDIVASACRLGLEGVIGKRRDSGYASRRTPEWIKLKCGRRQEFVIGGFTEPQGGRVGLGALMVGVHDIDGRLRYAGGVGTGFDDRQLVALRKQLDTLRVAKRPFAEPTENDRRARWVEPVLVAEVAFAEWTGDGHIRHAVFHGLRDDKPARQIVRETAIASAPADPPPAAARGRGLRIQVSHPERVVDAQSGVTKIELARFYGLVAPLMMEHLKHRPVSFVRAPSGIAGELFFQKHLDDGQMDGVRQLDPALWPGHAPLIEVATAAGLVSAAQMNVVEFHTWNAVKGALGRPDRMTFDLDPGEGVAWKDMLQAAELLRVFLEELALPAFCKTSGGKGLHVVVPVRREHDWDTVKDFSQAIVQHVARTLPKIFVAKSGPRNRVGRIFIDYLRNGFGATTACAWSARARPGLGVSVPVAWSELFDLKGGAQWTVASIHQRLDRGNEPWNGYARAGRSLNAAMKRLGFGG